MQEEPNEKFRPFVRDDQYGHAGLKRQPLLLRARLWLLHLTVLPLKFLCFVLVLFLLYFFCALTPLLPAVYEAAVLPFLVKLISRLGLLSLGFVDVRWVSLPAGAPPPPSSGRRGRDEAGAKEQPEAAAVVSNHCGYVDVAIHMARYFPSYLARRGTEHLVMVGAVARATQCLFVERENKTEGAAGVAGQVKARMEQHAEEEQRRAAAAAAGARGGCWSAVRRPRPMLLFPEGTTTNNSCLLPFKTGAFLAGLPVKPVVIKYGKVSRRDATDSS